MARRNLLSLLVIVLITQVPIYFISMLIGKAEFDSKSFQSFGTNLSIGSGIGEILLQILGILAFLYKVLCCAFVVEKTIQGDMVSIAAVLHHGVEKYMKAIMTLIPIVGIELLILGINWLLAESLTFLPVLTLLPLFLITIFEFPLVTTVSIRGITEQEAFKYSWELIKNKWWRLTSVYLQSIVIVAFLSCSFFLPFKLFMDTGIGGLPVFGGIIGDFFYMWVIIEMVLLYLDFEKTKAVPVESADNTIAGISSKSTPG